MNDVNYSGTATATLTISSANPSISFAVPGHTYGDAPFAVSASSSSTGAFTYSVLSGNATVSGNTITIAGLGTVALQASQAADSNYTAGSKQATFTISAAPLTITANNSSRPYGAANPAFTGTTTGQKYADTFTQTFATSATAASVPATYTIVPSVTGTNLADYIVTPNNGTLTVTQAATTTGLSVSSTQVAPNQTVTLIVNVASTTTGVPSGTAIVADNGVTLTTLTLSNGTATYTTLLSAAATHTLVATYSGDTNYLTSGSGGITVTVAPLDFTFGGTSTTAAITAAPGSTVTYSFNVSPSFGSYSAPVNFIVTGLPAGATASFSPATLAVNSGAQFVTLSIKLPQAIGANHSPLPNDSERAAIFAMLLPLAFSRRLRRKLHRRARIAVILLSGLAGVAALSGCGSSSGFLLQQPSTYNLNVTATSGSISHTQAVTLTVQ